MRRNIDLQNLLSAVDVPAQWVGLREVFEAETPRMIRDGVPVANMRYSTHGIMVEVLIDGQFGYYGTPDMTMAGIDRAAKKAFQHLSTTVVVPYANITFLAFYYRRRSNRRHSNRIFICI